MSILAINGPSLSQYPGSPSTSANKEKLSKHEYVLELEDRVGGINSTFTDVENSSKGFN